MTPEAEQHQALRRNAQVDRRLQSLGATEGSIGAINAALAHFDGKEFRKTIPARDVLIERMVDLTKGKRVPLAIFNCLDFDWEQFSGTYPRARILSDTNVSIVDYFQQLVQEDVAALEKLVPKGSSGGVDLCIIIPDSELFDDRVFPFAQTVEERKRIAARVKTDLSTKLSSFQTGRKNPVMFWSEYCKKYGLQSPTQYTASSANRLLGAATSNDRREKDLFSSVTKQMRHSKDHFKNKGMPSTYVEYDIPTQEMLQRIIWYCAMYMGEGRALADSKAIVLNLEDFRVGKWYNIGSSDSLPIVTPVNPNEYYQWRNRRRRLPN